MNTRLGLLIFTFLAICSNGRAAESTVRFLSIVHRHGERAPSKHYPLDPYKNDSFWPEGRKELVKIGKVNMFEVGKYLRERYDGFIPAKYKASEVLARSTIKNRAIMSAQLLLAGLYPPVHDQVWNPELAWQPIPVQTIDRSIDDMLCISKPCPLFARAYEDWTSRRRNIPNEEPGLVNYLRNHTGLEFKSDWGYDIHTVWDNLLIDEEQGYELPEWSKSVHPERTTAIIRDFLTTFRKNPSAVKLASGVLINDILTQMRRKQEEKDNFKRLLNLYSGHDSTIQNIWYGMRIAKEMPMPGYGALFIIELHEIQDKYCVKLLYKHSATEKNLTVLNVKGCEVDQELYENGLCDLDVLDSALEPAKITDFDKECFSPSGPGDAEPWYQC